MKITRKSNYSVDFEQECWKKEKIIFHRENSPQIDNIDK